MENKFFIIALLILIAACSTAPCPDKLSSQLKTSEKKYTAVELNKVSSYLTALSLYIINLKSSKKPYEAMLACDPRESKISPWIMKIKSLMDEQSIKTEPSELNDCYSSKSKTEICRKTFEDFCTSPLRNELISTY